MTDVNHPLLSEFGRWHRVASEVIHKVADDQDSSCLDEAMASAVEALKNAGNDYQTVLAVGLVRTVAEMKLLGVLKGQSQGPD
jgi:hypothetical protein